MNRGRVVRAAEGARTERILRPGLGEEQRRRVPREEMDARAAAARIVEGARSQAEAILAEARTRAAGVVEASAREAREEAAAQLASRWLALRQCEESSFQKDSHRAVTLAVLLAERLLGAALALDPARIADVARAVFAEARGARRAVVEAHPLDAEELRARISDGGLDLQSVEVRVDTALARGELRLQTDLGTIDARLAPRFERLAAALRDALG